MIKTHLTQRSLKCSMNPRLPLCKRQCMIESKFIKYIIFRLPVPLKPIFVLSFWARFFYLLYIATVPFFSKLQRFIPVEETRWTYSNTLSWCVCISESELLTCLLLVQYFCCLSTL